MKHPTFRLIIVRRYLDKEITRKDVKTHYKISISTLYKWIKLYKSNKLLKRKKRTQHKFKIPIKVKNFIGAYVNKEISFNYKLLIKIIRIVFRIQVSKSSIYSILSQLNYSRKKIRKKKIYGNRIKLKQKIKDFKEQVKNINKNNIISIDEVSFDTNLYPDNGWSKKGKRIYAEINSSRKRYTIICAISNATIIAVKIIDGSAKATDFLNFIKQDLKHIKNTNKNKFCFLAKNKINFILFEYLLLDNARIHKKTSLFFSQKIKINFIFICHAVIVKNYINTTTNKLLFNVPYTPEFNPVPRLWRAGLIRFAYLAIEKVFSIVKPLVRSHKNNEHNLINNIIQSFAMVTEQQLQKFFKQSLELFK